MNVATTAASSLLGGGGGAVTGGGLDTANLLLLAQQQQKQQSNSSATRGPAAIDYAAIRQRLLLEEQARRDLVAQALISAQIPQTHQTAAPNVAGLLTQIGMMGQGQTSSMLRGAEGIVAVAEAASKRQKLAVRDPQKDFVAVQLSDRERNAQFPLPSGSKGENGRSVRIGSLSSFRKHWTALNEKSTGILDPTLKHRFVAEFFSRKLPSSRKHNSSRLLAMARKNGSSACEGKTDRKRKFQIY